MTEETEREMYKADGLYYKGMGKRCGHCRNKFSLNASVGEKCRHCGTLWRYDQLEKMIQAATLYYEHTVKQCCVCKKNVSHNSCVGEKCPHCGKMWNHEELKERRLTQEEIAKELGVSRQTVSRLLQQANKYGVVRPVVVSHPVVEPLSELEEQVRTSLGLKKVILVPGREEMLDTTLLSGTREAILLTAARRAAQELDAQLQDKDILCLAWGYVVHTLLQFLHPSRPLPNLTVVPMLGVLSQRPTDYEFEANALVQTAARAYGTRNGYWLPAPAIVRHAEHRKMAMEHPIVKEVLAEIRKATFVITSLAPADEKNATLVKQGLLTPEDVKRVKGKDAIGEICGLWFDAQGEPVDDPEIQPIGMDIDGLKEVVRRGGTVMAVVAADRNRIAPLYAAIQAKLVNVVVTDHVTGKELVKRSDSKNVPNSLESQHTKAIRL